MSKLSYGDGAGRETQCSEFFFLESTLLRADFTKCSLMIPKSRLRTLSVGCLKFRR